VTHLEGKTGVNSPRIFVEKIAGISPVFSGKTRGKFPSKRAAALAAIQVIKYVCILLVGAIAATLIRTMWCDALLK